MCSIPGYIWAQYLILISLSLSGQIQQLFFQINTAALLSERLHLISFLSFSEILPFHKTSEHVQYTFHSWMSHKLLDKWWRRQTVSSVVLSSERASWWDYLISHKEIPFAFCPLLQVSAICIIRPLALPMPSPTLIQRRWGFLECPPWACAREANAEPGSTSFWTRGREFLPGTGDQPSRLRIREWSPKWKQCLPSPSEFIL